MKLDFDSLKKATISSKSRKHSMELLKKLFSEYQYVTLEHPDNRSSATEDHGGLDNQKRTSYEVMSWKDFNISDA